MSEQLQDLSQAIKVQRDKIQQELQSVKAGTSESLDIEGEAA